MLRTARREPSQWSGPRQRVETDEHSLTYSAASFDTGYASQAGSPAGHLPHGLGGYARPANGSDAGPLATEGPAFRLSHYAPHHRTWSGLRAPGLAGPLPQAEHCRMPSAPAASLRHEHSAQYDEPHPDRTPSSSQHSSPEQSLNVQSDQTSDFRQEGLSFVHPRFPWHHRSQTPTPPPSHPGALYEGFSSHSGVDGLAMASQGLPYSLRATPSISESSTDRGAAAEEIATMSVHKLIASMVPIPG